jgi:ankyrin repeat protein
MEYMKSAPLKAAENIFFHAAANSKATDIIKLIEEKEVDVDCRNVNGTTALHVAAIHQYSNIVRILLHFKANPNIAEYEFNGKKTALHHAVEKNNYDVCKLILDYGANPNTQDIHGSTA